MSGGYRAYGEYITTSVVWYKKKPAHWENERFKYNFAEKKKINSVSLSAGSISFGEVVYKNEDNLLQETKDSYQEVLIGEFLINPLNLNFDLKSLRTAISGINVVVSTGYIVLQNLGLLHPRFARWLMQQFDVSHMKTLGAGVRQTINYSDIGNSIFCRPPIKEQKTIAAFLDYETAKIDTLIEKQNQLIELLKEKRQAVISHAVTKGLNPDAPMKDSGIEWLGDIPDNWGIFKGKRIFMSVRNPAFDKDEHLAVSQKYGVLPQSLMVNLTDSRVVLALKGLDSFRHVDVDNFVISLRSFEGGIEHSKYCGCVSPAYTVLKSVKAINANYYRYFLKSCAFISILQSLTDSLREGKSISYEQFGGVTIPLAKFNEQNQIAKYLDHETSKIDTLIELQQQQINLLKERRTALISAAVTGKIDVRYWRAPQVVSESKIPEATV